MIQKQSICTSRSFGEMVTDLDSLKSSVVSFASSCASKLRGQHSLAKAVTVFVATNRFREDLPQYGNSQTEYLNIPTSDTLEIMNAAIAALKKIYLDGIHYKKSGVILSEISKAGCIQQKWKLPYQSRRYPDGEDIKNEISNSLLAPMWIQNIIKPLINNNNTL